MSFGFADCKHAGMFDFAVDGHSEKLLLDPEDLTEGDQAVELSDFLLDDRWDREQSETISTCNLKHSTVGKFASNRGDHIHLGEPSIQLPSQDGFFGWK